MSAKLEARFDALEAKFSRLEGKFETFQMWMMGITITMVVGFISMFLTMMLRF